MQKHKSKKAVFTFGRFNPPTRGHEKLIQVVEQIAHNINADSYIFVSSSQDYKRNPLNYDLKILFMKRLFPNAHIVINTDIKTPFQALGYLRNQEYTDIIFVVGQDRVQEFKERFNRPLDYFNTFEIVSAGIRNVNDSGVDGMSSTRAREAASNNNLEMFKFATGWNDIIAQELLQAVRKGMKLNV